MMKRSLILIAALCCLAACDKKKSDTAEAEEPTWTANIELVDATGEAGLLVKLADQDDFVAWSAEKPIPAGASVRTPTSVRASLALPHDGAMTMNHSTTVKLARATNLELSEGQVVLEYRGSEKHDPVTVKLPQGDAVLHGTKVGIVAGERDSSVTVSQGLVEVRNGTESAEVRPGQEVILREGVAPVATQTPELGRRIGWSEIGERDDLEALPEVPRGLGKLVGKVPGGGEQEHEMQLVKHRVDAKIQGNLAYTEIHESFRNPVNQTLEGIYRFPLPPDARISRLSLKVGDKWMEGEFLDNDRAQEIWEDVKKPIKKITQRRMKEVVEWVWKDPALLKWKEGNTFELRIFPIPAKEIREVKIGYVQRLHPSASGYSYTYPMPVDRAGLIPAERFEFAAELYGHDATQPLEVVGYQADVKTGATDDDSAVAKVSWAEDDFVARGDLDIRFGRRDAIGLRTSTFTEKKKDPYAVFVIRPNIPAPTEVRPRDFVIVLDSSLSRSGAAFEAQRQIVPRMIREMDPLDRVAVVTCSESCDAVGDAGFQPARYETASKVESSLAGKEAEGASYPVEAMRVAADLFRRRKSNDREAHIVYFTDGVASVGELRPGRIGQAVQRTLSPFETRMSIVNVGGDTDDLVLAALASAGRGRVMELDPMLTLTGQALDVLSGHYRSVLEGPKLTLPQGVQAAPELPNVIAAGDELVITARFPAAMTGEFKLSGTLGAQPFSSRYPVKLEGSDAKGNTFVPGEWATQRIERLELEPDSNRDEIVELSTTYGVLSRYTSLLALESDQMMRDYKVEKRERTQWTGEEAAEEVVTQEIPKTPRKASKAKPRPTTRSAAPRAKKMEPMMDDEMFLPDGLGAAGRGLPSRPPIDRRRRGRRVVRYVPMKPVAIVQQAESTTDWERKNVERRKKRLDDEPTNRSRRMEYVRAMIRSGDLETANKVTKEWFAINPMDPEARVQQAQLFAQEARIDDFYAALTEALDAAPRGRWLQERVQRSAAATGDDALRCAMDVALEATAKDEPKNPADILACPMMTTVGEWFGQPGPSPRPPVADASNAKGDIVVELTSKGGDWDIIVLEPSGRPLWWGSSRRGLTVSNVLGADRTETWAAKKLRDGTYSVYAVPRTGKAGDFLEVQIRTHSGSKRTFKTTAPSATPFEVAEVVRRWE